MAEQGLVKILETDDPATLPIVPVGEVWYGVDSTSYWFKVGSTVTRLTVGTNSEDVSCDAMQTANQDTPSGGFTPILFDTTNFDTDSMFDNTVQDSGTATGVQTGTTLQDTTQTWGVNDYAFMCVKITGGTGAGQVRKVTSNTADTLTVPTWTTTPDGTSTYEILITNRITIAPDKAGKYLIIPTLTYQGSAVGLRGIAIWKNTSFIWSTFANPVGAVESLVPIRTLVLDLVPGDFITFDGYQTSGGVLRTLGSSSRKVNLTVVRQPD